MSDFAQPRLTLGRLTIHATLLLACAVYLVPLIVMLLTTTAMSLHRLRLERTRSLRPADVRLLQAVRGEVRDTETRNRLDKLIERAG